MEKAFTAVRHLEDSYPKDLESLSPARGLCFVGDELAKDTVSVDQAYFVVSHHLLSFGVLEYLQQSADLTFKKGSLLLHVIVASLKSTHSTIKIF